MAKHPNHDNQLWLEHEYAKRHIHKLIIDDIRTAPKLVTKLTKGVNVLLDWLNEESAYESKANRKTALRIRYTTDEGLLDLMPLVEYVVATVVRGGYTTINNIAMSCRKITHLTDRQALDLACEVISLLADTDLYDITKPTELIMVKSLVVLSDDVLEHIEQTCYTPPLVIPPKKVIRNWDTPYYTYAGESLILGSTLNFHEGDICLDVINIQNSIPLALSTDFMACYQEPEPDHKAKALKERGNKLTKIELVMAEKNWERYQNQCVFFSYLLEGLGNRIYLGNKVDKRGRMYCSGYHVSPQGNSYRKAVVELADKESIDIPVGFF